MEMKFFKVTMVCVSGLLLSSLFSNKSLNLAEEVEDQTSQHELISSPKVPKTIRNIESESTETEDKAASTKKDHVEESTETEDKAASTKKDHVEDSAETEDKAASTKKDQVEDSAEIEDKAASTKKDHVEDSAEIEDKAASTKKDQVEDSAETEDKAANTKKDQVEDSAETEDKTESTKKDQTEDSTETEDKKESTKKDQAEDSAEIEDKAGRTRAGDKEETSSNQLPDKKQLLASYGVNLNEWKEIDKGNSPNFPWKDYPYHPTVQAKKREYKVSSVFSARKTPLPIQYLEDNRSKNKYAYLESGIQDGNSPGQNNHFYLTNVDSIAKKRKPAAMIVNKLYEKVLPEGNLSSKTESNRIVGASLFSLYGDKPRPHEPSENENDWIFSEEFKNLELFETLETTPDGRFIHTYKITNNNQTIVKGLKPRFGLNTTLAINNGGVNHVDLPDLPYYADGKRGIYVVDEENDFELWAEPLKNVELYPGKFIDGQELNEEDYQDSPIGKEAGEQMGFDNGFFLVYRPNDPIDLQPGETYEMSFQEKLNISAKNEITVEYVDMDGNKLSEDDHLIGEEEERYETTAKEIEGYELKERPKNASGQYGKEKVTVTYKYDKIKTELDMSIDFSKKSKSVKVGDEITATVTIPNNLQKDVTDLKLNSKLLAHSLVLDEGKVVVKKLGKDGNLLSENNISVTNSEADISLPDKLAPNEKYEVVYTGRVWNNISEKTKDYLSKATLTYNVSSTETLRSEVETSFLVENGSLGFTKVPEVLELETTQLTPNAKDQLVNRAEETWGIILSDLRGTNPTETNQISRQDWKIMAKAPKFVDASNGNPSDGLHLVHIDNQGMEIPLNEKDSIEVYQGTVQDELPINNHKKDINWNKDEGLKAKIDSPSDLKAKVEYKARIEFDLVAAP